MNINKILKSSKKTLLNESGIRIPNNIYAAKILYHDDTDGIASAKTVLDQLERQGLKKENIILRPVSDSTSVQEEEILLTKKPGQMLIAVDFDRFKNEELANNIDFHTDHHETQKMVARGGGKTGQTQFRSDTDHLQTKFAARNEPDFARVITKVDSADFGEDFEDVVLNKLNPSKKGGDRLLRLANRTNSLISQLLRSRRNIAAAEALAKVSKQSIPNFYLTTLKFAKLNNLQVEAISELKKKNPNMEKVDAIRRKVKEEGSMDMAKAISKENPQNLRKISFPEETEKLASSGLEAMQKELDDPASEKITQEGGVIIQNITGVGQPGRYTNFMLKGSEEINAQMRQWATLLQVSLSPKATSKIREGVNLTVILEKVLKDVRDEFQDRYNEWAFNLIMKESGGHAGITNVSALGTIGIMPKKLREEYKEILNSDKYRRLKALPAKTQKKLMELEGFSSMNKRLKELEEEKKSWAKKRKQVIESIKRRMLEEVNKAINELKE